MVRLYDSSKRILVTGGAGFHLDTSGTPSFSGSPV